MRIFLLLAALGACKPDMPVPAKLPPLVPHAPPGDGGSPPTPTDGPAPATAAGLLGFAPVHAAEERARRGKLAAAMSTAQIDRDVVELAREPHLAGTPGAARVAGVLQKRLADAGFAVTTSEYTIYLPQPVKISVTVGGKAIATRERPGSPRADGLPVLPATAPELVTWNAYSASGTVTAPVVYAGFGMEADLAALSAAKVELRGRVALLRYGSLYRGAQVASVERAGAKAVIFYSDGKDEPNRDPDTVQRGTVAYYWQYTGDPLTPGVPSNPGAAAVTPAKSATLPKIPVVTISATAAAPLLAQIAGAPAGESMATPSAKSFGPGPAVTVSVQLDGKSRVIRDVVGRLAGASDAEGAVMLGNHYDAWVYGALDPHSGTAALLEVADGLGALAKAGWTPARPIEIAFWDAEEPGVIGSTEWVEEKGDALGVFAYFNIDTVKQGPIVVQGAPQLRDYLSGCVGEGGVTFKDIGIGSDWTAFLHHAGVMSTQWLTGAGGKGTYDAWHSVDDDVAAARAKSDPGWLGVASFARAMGTCAMGLADADALPIHYAALAPWLGAALGALPKGGAAVVARHDIDAAIDAFATAARGVVDKPACNGVLARLERDFVVTPGLVDRPWYRHVLTGPNPANGYGALLLPELAAATDQAAMDRASARVLAALAKATADLGSCAQAREASPTDSR